MNIAIPGMILFSISSVLYPSKGVVDKKLKNI